jgi:hypothetical protein
VRIVLLCTRPDDLTLRWVHDGLVALDHRVDAVHRPDLPLTDAGALGHQLADAWRTAPDVVLALDTVAGVAGLVALRERPAPLVLRPDRPGRGTADRRRVESAVARGAVAVLAASAGEAELVVTRLGAARPRVQVLPEAVDVAALRPARSLDDPEPVVVADDSPASVHTLLRGMAQGRPGVVADTGVLPDLVAEGVCGLVVPAREADLRRAEQALRADTVRCSAMGMAAADRVAACFDTATVVPSLDRVLGSVRGGASTAA